MKISELLSKETIKLNLKANNKQDVIDQLVDVLDKAGRLENKEQYKEAILKREGQSSTGIGDGIAIPHAKTSAVKKASLALGLFKDGVDYEALDDAPINIAFMIAAPEGANNEHLETLSNLSVLLMNDDFKKGLLASTTPQEVLALLDKFEEKEEEEVIEEVPATSKEKYVLAVTACPTGIAHTFMAADSLIKTAKEMGVKIKVETNGSAGIKNHLTQEEIDNCDGIIVAADKQVEMSRFNGKKVVIVPVVQGIKRPKELINQALNGEAPVYAHSGDSGKATSGTKEKSGFYKHLMSGVSNMLPLVVGGGILIAISFMFGIKAYDPADPSYNAIAALLKSIGDGAFGLIVPILAGFIGSSIADRPGFAPAIVGGVIASTSGAGFLGGLIAGFIGGYSVVFLKKVFSKLPSSLDGLKPVLLYPLFGILITGVIMSLLVVSPVSTFNGWLQNWLLGMGTGNKVILGLILGAMMCIDMGGPINKAAFTFGIAMIDAGNFGPHAAVMAGGMVPPLAIALASTVFFRNKFTKDERDAGLTNYIMGLTFITEGAIPFAAADPLRVIPACAIGGGVAGALAMAFNIGLPAPHGGILVAFIVNGNPLLYLLAIAIGAVVGALILGFLKKPIENN